MYKQRWHKKYIAMILSIAMVLGMLPMSAFALDAVCIVNGVEYTAANSAIPDAFYYGGTLTLLQDIDYTNSVSLEAHKSLTIELNGHTLTLKALTVKISGNLTLSGEGPGAQLNINNTSPSLAAVDVMNSARATVSNITSAGYAAVIGSSGSLRVSGNAQGSATGVTLQNSSHASLEIGGNLTVYNGDYGINAHSSGGGNSITINGDVRVINTDGTRATGVYATDSPTIINGMLYVQGAEGSWDIKMGSTVVNRSLGQGTYNTSTGYFDYTYWDSRVSVKGYELALDASAGGTSTASVTGPCEGGRKINLTATPSAHHTFAGWTSSSGGSFVNSANASTIFVMPAAATTVKANFTYYNTTPARRNGVQATASANMTYGGAYTLNLSDIFTDADGDTLTYKVSVNGAAAIGAAASYSYTPVSAGTTVLTFTANDGYTDSTDSYTVTLTTDKKTPTAADLTYNLAAKTYNGLVQPLSVTGPAGLGAITVKYDGSTIQPKDAKTYTVTASIAADTDYTATTVDILLGSYTINRRNLTISGASTKTYDGTTEATGITLTFDGLQNSETLAPGTDYTVTNAQFDSAGAGGGKTVTGTVELTNSAIAQNYALVNGALNLPGQIISKAVAPAGVNRTLNVVINHTQDYEFNLTTLLPVIDSPRTLGTVTYVIKNTSDTGNVLGTLDYTSGNMLTIPVRSVSDANKTAVITVTVRSTNYGDFDADVTVTTVGTIPLTVAGLTVNDKTYDGTNAATLIGTATLVTDNVQQDDTVSLSGAPSAAFVNPNAGPNKAVTVTGLSLTGADAYKYHLDLSGLTGIITAKPLTVPMLTVTGGQFSYTGTAQTPAITVQDGGTPLVLNTDYEAIYTNNINVGTATVSVAGKGNYQGTISKDFTIEKTLLTITGGTVAAKTYDGTTDAMVTGITFSGLQNGETLTLGTDYTVSDVAFDSASAGSGKTVTATVSLNNTAKANNYSLANGSLTLTSQTIQKGTIADITFDITVATNLANDYIMSDQKFTGILADLTGKALGTVTYNITSVDNTDGVLVALLPTGPLTFPATLRVADTADADKRATLIGTVTSANYNDFTVNTVIRTVDRIPVTISGLTMTGGIYNGSSYAYSGTPLFASSLSGNPVSIPEFNVLYTSTDSGGYSSSIAPRNAGAYQLTISVSNNDQAYTGSKSYAFTIVKRPVVIRANDKSMTPGSSLPAFTYTVDGQLPGEAALTGVPFLACATDGKTAGNYDISPDLTGISYTDNYTAANPAIVNGTLRVNNPDSGSPSGGSSTVTTNTEKQPNQPITAVASVTAIAGANITASASIPDHAITDAIAKAQSEARTLGISANDIAVDLNITMPQGATSLSTTLTQNSLQSLVSAGVTSLTINSSPVKVTFDLKSLQEIQTQSDGTINISIAPPTNLSTMAKAMIGTRPVYNITVGYGSGKIISEFGSGTATVSIPYIPAKGEAVGALYAVYVDEKGNATRIAGSSYDANSRSIIFRTTHFSMYGVGYTAPSAKFNDIGSHWAKESIDYVVGRGLFGGNAEGKFNPNAAITRGEFVAALGRMTGVDDKAYTKSSFTDVKADSYYLPYIEWAYEKGVIQGIGNSQFAPDRAITRQEIAVILQNYAKATGYKLPVTRTATSFADISGIGSTFKSAVAAMQQASIMMGDQNNRFNPNGNTTRAEASTILHRYIKLTIDPATAQAWVLNDDGQYLYYKDGKAYTGWQTIDGVKYIFNTDGTLKTGWVKDGVNWRYYSGNKARLGWLDISDKRYYFTKDGIMVAGKWLELDGKWYYYYDDGSLAKSTKIDEFEVDENGVRKTK